ncbi:MAG: sigma-70 family RNA polymerase sigma factor, partial [Candidatus Latescibacteria bacterium]|nr:sigma-70 family RNA polymerase sigma factor [Candidatus Latescibacterota bacterium]
MNVETLYNTYGPMVLRRCRHLLKDEERALDAMQDVFVRVLQRQNQLKSDYPSSLLYRIATNICLNYIRDQRTTTPGDDILTRIAGLEEPEPRLEARSVLNTLFNRHQT